MARWPLLLLLLLALPRAEASELRTPYEVVAELDGAPSLGATIELRVALVASQAVDEPFVLDVPAWVAVEGDRAWYARAEAGGRLEHTWRVTPTREGFWQASLAVPGSGSWTPLVHAWSAPRRGLWSTRDPAGAVPGESTVGYYPSFRALDAESAEITLRLSPQDRRYTGQTLLFEMDGTTQQAPAATAYEFTRAFPLQAGQTTLLTPVGAVLVTFETGEHVSHPSTFRQHVACANIEVERVGEDVHERRRWGCSVEPAPARAIPSAAWSLALLLALAARSAYPRRPE